MTTASIFGTSGRQVMMTPHANVMAKVTGRKTRVP